MSAPRLIFSLTVMFHPILFTMEIHPDNNLTIDGGAILNRVRGGGDQVHSSERRETEAIARGVSKGWADVFR
jgi:hypothetical protein